MKDLSLHVMDIARNSVAAGATVIGISLVMEGKWLVLRIDDNGNGMEKKFLENVTDPFTTTRTTRKVGMGIPLLKQSAEMTGGSFTIKSEKGVGTTVEAVFDTDSIDRIPIGDMDETIKALIQANPELDYEIRFERGGSEYELKTIDIKNYLKGVPIMNASIMEWMGKNIREGLNQVFGGVLNEISG